MNSDVLAHDREMIEMTNEIYGSNRIDYDLFVMGMCGNEQVYASQELQEMTHSQVRFDVTQKFPENEFASALKASQTEIAQVHGAPSKFQYCQSPFGVEFILSRMSGVNATNIGAGIIKNLNKKYDSMSWNGEAGNSGIIANPKAETTGEAWTDWATFKTAFDGAMARLKMATDITSSGYSMVHFSYSADIAILLSDLDTNNYSNMEKLEKAYPMIVFREIPKNLSGDASLFTLNYRPMCTFHRASVPSVNAQEQGKYGKSLDTLYAFETMAVEVEVMGALQIVNNTAPRSKKK